MKALASGCSLCGCRTPRADCPRCSARQLSLFDPSPILPIPDDAETTTIDELAAVAKRAREAASARLAKLASLGRPIKV